MSTEAPEVPITPAAPTLNTDENVKCGYMVNTAKGDKPCQKPLGHDNTTSPFYEKYGKGHVSKIQLRKDYKPVSKKSLATLDDVDDSVEVAYGAVGAGEQDRTKMFGGEQPTVDDHVKDNYQKWLDAGKPKDFNKSPRARYLITQDEEDTFRAMLRAAARYHGVAVKMPGTLTPHQNGKFILYWSAQDIAPRKAGEKAPEPHIQ